MRRDANFAFAGICTLKRVLSLYFYTVAEFCLIRNRVKLIVNLYDIHSYAIFFLFVNILVKNELIILVYG